MSLLVTISQTTEYPCTLYTLKLQEFPQHASDPNAPQNLLAFESAAPHLSCEIRLVPVVRQTNKNIKRN